MIDARASYEKLLDKVEGLLSDVTLRVQEAGKIASATTSQLDTVNTAVDDTLAKTKVARAAMVRAIQARANERADKVAMARHIFKVAERLDA